MSTDNDDSNAHKARQAARKLLKHSFTVGEHGNGFLSYGHLTSVERALVTPEEFELLVVWLKEDT